MIIDFQIGTVLKVYPEQDKILVKSHFDESSIEMIVNNTLEDQCFPREGNRCLFIQLGSYWTFPVKFWEHDNAYIRGYKESLNPENVSYLKAGEKQIQGIGKSYMLFDAEGNISIVDGNFANSIRLDMSENAAIIEAFNIKFKNFKNIELDIDDDTFALTKKDSNGNEVIRISFDKDNNVTLKCAKLNVISDDIRLGGNKSIVVTDLPSGSSIPDVRMLQASSIIKGG